MGDWNPFEEVEQEIQHENTIQKGKSEEQDDEEDEARTVEGEGDDDVDEYVEKERSRKEHKPRSGRHRDMNWEEKHSYFPSAKPKKRSRAEEDALQRERDDSRRREGDRGNSK